MTEKIIVPNLPFVSDLMANFIRKNDLEILKNDFTTEDERFERLKIIDDKQLKQVISNGKDVAIYSNSENSLSDILKIFAGSELADKVNLFKDKYLFRQKLQSIYPDFYYQKISANNLRDLLSQELPYPLVLKPQCGFLSMGVYPLYSLEDLENAINKIESENKSRKILFPEEVVNFDNFLLEQMIDGEEYAVDAYFDSTGKPVVLNIFYHPFVDSQDVSDRIYVTSSTLIKANLEKITLFLEKIAKLVDLKNFPFHIELRKNGENFIPIECNPLRFAGWCMTDLAYYAYGISSYDYFFNGKKPDWEKILNEKDNSFYYFSIAEVPQNICRENIEAFDYSNFSKEFSECYRIYPIDFRHNPVFAILFGRCQTFDEVQEILCRDLTPFIITKK